MCSIMQELQLIKASKILVTCETPIQWEVLPSLHAATLQCVAIAIFMSLHRTCIPVANAPLLHVTPVQSAFW